MHIPKCNTAEAGVFSFEAALLDTGREDYDRDAWLYVPDYYAEYRYILGTRGKNPLICIGVNPSTARPGDLDPTLSSVQRIAAFNGFDSFIMFNVYAQRATDPDHMERECNAFLHRENMRAFSYVLELTERPCVWAAWGTVIRKREYLTSCVRDMIEIGKEYDTAWFTAGKRSKIGGHPHHPLYLKKDSKLDSFDVETYLAELTKK